MTDSTGVATTVREVALAPGGEVSINLTSSDVRVTAVDGDVVTIRTRGGEDIDDEILVEDEPGRVFIRDAERGYRIGPVRFGSGGSVALDVDVPRTARLICKTLSGDVEAHGVGHESRWSTASGDLHLVVEGGSLIVDTMSGDATVESAGPIGIRARTVSGDLRLHAPKIEALQASSTSGDIRLDADLGSAFEHIVTSVSGDVFLHTSSPVRLETQTIAGDVRATGVHSAEGGRGRRTIIVGDGSVRLGVKTTSGDIRLQGRGTAGIPPIPMPAAPAGPAAPAMPKSPAMPKAPRCPAAPVPPVAPAPPARRVVGRRGGRGSAQPRPPRQRARRRLVRCREHGRPTRGRPPRHPPRARARGARHRGRLVPAGPARRGRSAQLPGVLLMAADPLDDILRLVAEGRLSAEEAGPLLAALDEAPAPSTRGGGGPTAASAGDRASSSGRTPLEGQVLTGSPSTLRIEVRDNGRSVVNLRLPMAVGRFALDRVPGLSGDQVTRVREAMNSGFRGPVLVVDDGGSGVRIVLE